VLLLPDGAPDDFEPVRRHLGEFVATLRYDGADIMLVRPDAHLAWRGRPGDREDLYRWLTAALGSGTIR
jgi:4,5-epoxidase